MKTVGQAIGGWSARTPPDPPRQIEHAAALIRAGKLVAFPTETVYGLGANALDAQAVERIFVAKGRPRTSPLIVHVDSVDMARTLGSEWPAAADLLARRYWPGPLTLVVPKRPEIPDIVTAGLPTVGLRMPAHPLELSPTAAGHVAGSLAEFVLNGGPSQVGIESTVLSLAGEPLLLRPGVIPLPEIEALIGPVQVAPLPREAAHPAPGMHERHYRPRTPLHLLCATDAQPGGRGAWLRIGREMPPEPRAYAAALYETLHRLDQQGLDWIAVERPPDTPDWAGVLDRLQRAAV
jgi:L-threonylcarbamoyladenylate synthase